MKNPTTEITQTLAEIKEAVRSIHDIIPFKDMPFCIPESEDKYIKTFGKDTFQRYRAAIDLINQVRDEVKLLLLKSGYDSALMSTIVLKCLTVALCGVGECSEQSALTFCTLLTRNYPENIYWIWASSTLGKNHTFVLLSNSDSLKINTIQEMKSLDDNCLLLDPLFGIFGKANEISTHLKDIIELHDISVIEDDTRYTAKLHAGVAISLLEAAKLISNTVKTKLNVPKRIAEIYHSNLDKTLHSHSINSSSIFHGKKATASSADAHQALEEKLLPKKKSDSTQASCRCSIL